MALTDPPVIVIYFFSISCPALAKFAAKSIAYFLQKLPKPLLTIDQLKLLKYDNILSGKNKSNADIGFISQLKFESESDLIKQMEKDCKSIQIILKNKYIKMDNLGPL